MEEFQLLGLGAVASITVVAYLAGLAVKASPWNNDHTIPVVCGFVGAVMGLISFLYHAEDFPVNDPVTAIAIGIVSGLSATGINQASKQLATKNLTEQIVSSLEGKEE